MSTKAQYILGAVIALPLLLAIVVGGSYQVGYRNGQVDAANGKINYELHDNPDGTRLWVKKEPR